MPDPAIIAALFGFIGVVGGAAITVYSQRGKLQAEADNLAAETNEQIRRTIMGMAAEWKDKITSLEGKIVTMEAKIADLQAENTTLKARVADLEAENEALARQVTERGGVPVRKRGSPGRGGSPNVTSA